MHITKERRNWNKWRDVAESNGVTFQLFYDRMKRGWFGKQAAQTPVQRKRAEYALYRGEELLAVGTVKELAEMRGVSEKTIYFCASPSYLKRVGDSTRRIVVVRLDD